MINFFQQKGGISIIGVLLLGIILIGALSYFHVNIKSVMESPEGQDNIHYVTAAVQNVWNNYLKTPVVYIWNHVILEIVHKMRESGDINFNTISPGVPR